MHLEFLGKVGERMSVDMAANLSAKEMEPCLA